jgi:hypothetical protein
VGDKYGPAAVADPRRDTGGAEDVEQRKDRVDSAVAIVNTKADA